MADELIQGIHRKWVSDEFLLTGHAVDNEDSKSQALTQNLNPNKHNEGGYYNYRNDRSKHSQST